MPGVIPASELILQRMQEEEAELERTKDERAAKLRQQEARAKKRAVLEKAAAEKAKEELTDKEKMFKACEIGDVETIYLLIRKLEREQEETLIDAHGVGSLVDATTPDGATPLYFACKNGFVECARILLQYGATPARGTHAGGFSPLWIACAKGRREYLIRWEGWGAAALPLNPTPPI